MDRIAQLKSVINNITPIPEEEWNKIKPHLKIQQFAKSEMLQEMGKAAELLFFISKGLVRQFYLDSEGKEFIKSFNAENEIAAAYADILLKRNSTVGIEALEDVECVVFNHKQLLKAYSEHPVWNEIGRKICEKYFIEKENRIYHFLNSDAKSRYQNFELDYARVSERISQYHLASYLGISPVSLSRLKNN